MYTICFGDVQTLVVLTPGVLEVCTSQADIEMGNLEGMKSQIKVTLETRLHCGLGHVDRLGFLPQWTPTNHLLDDGSSHESHEEKKLDEDSTEPKSATKNYGPPPLSPPPAWVCLTCVRAGRRRRATRSVYRFPSRKVA